MQTIVIVEDEGSISRVLQVYLEKAGYQVELAFDGEEAITTFDRVTPSLVLLDVMLPRQSGWKVLEYIRSKSSCLVIMLTALGQLDQKITGLNQGADDYITKPFIGEEVVARVNAVMRRSLLVVGDYQARIFGSLKVDYQTHSVMLQGIELTFTPRVLSLFLFLAQHPNQTFTREQLIEHVWGMDYEGSDRAVDLAVKRIRRILQNWPTDEGEIRTIRRLGYQFCVNEK
ncbi:DNA-binding response regulator [Brevibacillus laterosporus]|nr:response regulator transcription factor [Brevibacillus laterosporus]TPG68544.1 DNA-binding response regulator [Brevibacillus laterosporus]